MGTEQVYVAQSGESEEILQFLQRAPELNAWLTWFVSDGLRADSAWRRVLLCRRSGEIAAVANLEEDTRENRTCDLNAMADAIDPDAAAALVDAFPHDRRICFTAYSPAVQAHLDRLPDIKRSEGDLYFTVSRQSFRPAAGDDVVELTPADAALFAGLENQPNWENAERHRMYAILRDGKAVASLWAGALPPEDGTTRRVCTICVVHVESAYRRMGLGKRVVSYATDLILQAGDTVIYWTEPENVASQGLCKSLGYRQYAQCVRYQFALV